MKVYELMTELAKMPAGAEVEFTTLMTLAEFAELHTDVVDENGKDLYRVSGEIKDVEKISDKRIALYY